jgi:hypothetical protein
VVDTAEDAMSDDAAIAAIPTTMVVGTLWAEAIVELAVLL